MLGGNSKISCFIDISTKQHLVKDSVPYIFSFRGQAKLSQIYLILFCLAYILNRPLVITEFCKMLLSRSQENCSKSK